MDLGWVRRVSCDGFGVGQDGVMWGRSGGCHDGFGVAGQEDVM